jgi:hypothetical protein
MCEADQRGISDDVDNGGMGGHDEGALFWLI